MRNLVLLLLVVLALLLVLKFFPAGDAEGAGGGPFLERPGDVALEEDEEFQDPVDAGGASSGSLASGLGSQAGGGGGEFPGAADPDPGDLPPPPDQDLGDELSEVLAAEPEGEGPAGRWDPSLEVSLAGAVLHGTREELDAAIGALGRSLPEGRAALARAYHRAMSGDAERARRLATQVSADATTTEERRLLSLALGGRGVTPRPASMSVRSDGPVARAMAIGLREREAAQALEDRDHPAAAVAYSDVLKATVDSPWRAAREDLRRWSEALHQAQARHRWDPSGDWAYVEYEVQGGDNLVRIRRRYLDDHPDQVMCTGLISKASGLRSSTIHKGRVLRVPTARVTALVDLSSRWVFYLHDDEVVYAWECAIGREGEETITGTFTAGDKIPEPPWTKVGQRIVPYGDPENPLGTRWITWMRDGVKTSFGFHGTWEPESLGKEASDGCIRLHNENIELLFDLLPQGAVFTVRD